MSKSHKVIGKFLNRIKEGYYIVSDDGKLFRNGKELGGKPLKNGYLSYNISDGRVYAHRLMYAYYHGLENLDPDLSINHINGIKTDNRKENLEQVSLAENTKHQWREGLATSGEELTYAKLTEKEVKEIKILLKNGVSQYIIADMFNVSRSTILSINTGRSWANVTPDEGMKPPNVKSKNRRRTDAKLSEEDVNEIKELLKNKVTQAEIAKKFKVSRSLIGGIASGKRYK